MKHERLFEPEIEMPFSDSPKVERIKTKLQDRYLEKSKHDPRKRPTGFFVEPLKKTIETPHLDRILDDFPDKSMLISRFIEENGPQAVVKNLGRVFGNIPSFDAEIMKYATGTVFERLAFSLLKDKVTQESHKQRTVLDPGSVSRTFNSLRHYGQNFTPDGMIVSDLTNFNRTPVLYGLCEYKMSADKDFEDLKSQINKMQTFFDRFVGQTMTLDTRLDKKLNKRHKELKVHEKTTITVITSPFHALSQEQTSQFQAVDFILTTFPNKLVEKLAIASILDFREILPPADLKID